MSRKITLTQGRVTTVDDSDYEWLTKWKWCAYWTGWNWYAIRRRPKVDGPGRGLIRMHREILDVPPHLQVDHVSGNGLDNRRTNLRLATPFLNALNRRRRKARGNGLPMGVSADRRRFRAGIMRRGKQVWLGTFDTPETARAVYLAAREKGIAEEKAAIGISP